MMDDKNYRPGVPLVINGDGDTTDNQVDKLQLANNKLEKKTQALARKIVREKTLEGVQDLTHLFNVAQVKKQVLRNLTYNQLLDKITLQMGERLDKRADQFSNKDLLDYAKVVQDGIDKAQKQIQSIDATPSIQVNNTQNNILIQGDELDRESRQRVMSAAKAAMDFLMQQGAITTPIEVEDLSDGDIVVVDEESEKNFNKNLNSDDINFVLNFDEDFIEDDEDEFDEDEDDESFDIIYTSSTNINNNI